MDDGTPSRTDPDVSLAHPHPSDAPAGGSDEHLIRMCGTGDVPDDLVDFDTAAVILGDETGHPVPASTLRRWAKRAGISRWPSPGRRAALPSLSDLLRVHAEHMPEE